MSPPTRSNKKSRAHKVQNGKNCPHGPKNLPRGQKGTDISPEERWNMRYEELKKFKEENKHCNVPRGYSANRQLGEWVNNQRALCKKGKLREDRINNLDSIGFCWDYRKDKWDQRFNQLGEFKEDSKKGTISAQEVKWNMRYEELKKFKEENKHCNVPQRCSANPQLGDWVNNQRAFRKKGALREDRINDLDSIGFSWGSYKGWDHQFEELKEFKEEKGHCIVPRGYSANPQLGIWVHNQRTLCKKGKLSDDRIRRIKEIGFLWEVQGRGKATANISDIESDNDSAKNRDELRA